MRVVTRPDFDGIVCAVLLYEVENVDEPVKWIEPNEIDKGMVQISKNDIIANLPYDTRCGLWFDHHYSNRLNRAYNGLYRIAPSAAGLIFEYYKGKFQRDYIKLVRETDKIDSAKLNLDEILHPEKYPYIMLSMTISNSSISDESYWNRVVDLLKKYDIEKILKDKDVKKRCEITLKRNKVYKKFLKQNTEEIKHVSITDFRSLDKVPTGNRFLVFTLFPESFVNLKIRFDDKNKKRVILSIGSSILNKNCRVNLGELTSRFGGGGHFGAGSCSFDISKADLYIERITDILLNNKKIIEE